MNAGKEEDKRMAKVRTKRKMSTGCSNEVCTNYKGIIRLETRIVRVQDYIHICTYNIYGSTYIYTHTHNLLELGLGQWLITA